MFHVMLSKTFLLYSLLIDNTRIINNDAKHKQDSEIRKRSTKINKKMKYKKHKTVEKKTASFHCRFKHSLRFPDLTALMFADDSR